MSDVRGVLSLKKVPGCFSPNGNLKEVPGVGVIQEVCVTTGKVHSASIEFLTGTSINYRGLAYVVGFPPPPDSCSVSLGGPWLQLSPVNKRTMNCSRGFNFNGGG